MNVVIPQNFQEGQSLYDHLKTLTSEEIEVVRNSYLKKGYDFMFGPEKAGQRGAFEITVSGDRILFYNSYKISLITKTEKGLKAYDQLPNKSEYWTLNGRSHREDGPATIYHDGGVRYYAYHGRNLDEVVGALIRKIFPPVVLSVEKSKWNFIKSLIEFLWQNGYQFGEYLPGSFQVDENDKLECVKFLKQIESGEISEEEVLEDLRNSYFEYIVLTRLKNIKIEASNNDDDACMEILKNMNLIESNPSIEQLFKNWQTYDEIQESFSLKAFWNYN
jgi:hypothetical protein